MKCKCKSITLAQLRRGRQKWTPVVEVAERFGVTRAAIYWRIEHGLLTARSFHGLILVDMTNVKA